MPGAFLHRRTATHVENEVMLTLYGQVASRAARCMWALAELQVPYALHKVNQSAGESRTPEYMKVNPNGRVPALRDGELVMFESMAINLYLAQKFGAGSLWPADPQDQARALMWSFWSQNEVEIHVVDLLRHRFLYPPEKRKPELAEAAVAALPKPLAVLDGALSGHEYLAGKSFSVADLNVASVLGLGNIYKQLDMAPYENVNRWLERCLSRPAHQKVHAPA
jgi:glutathione S-transferase